MKRLPPVLLCMGLCCLLGLSAGVLERWARPDPKGGDILDLALGLGFMGIFPGLLWARLERGLDDVAAGRHRLLVHGLVSTIALGAVGALVLAGLSAIFGEALKRTGFMPPTADLPRIAALGFTYGSLPGLALGYLTAASQTFARSRA